MNPAPGPHAQAIISIGSNQGDSRSYLAQARAWWGNQLRESSAVYRTAPWGNTNQQDFLNQTLLIETDLSPEELLHQCQDCEAQAQRRREIHWGPRTLDVDIIDYRNPSGQPIQRCTPDLTLPHPWAHQRAFVLIPWQEIEPDATLGGVPITQLIDALPAAERAGVTVETSQAAAENAAAAGSVEPPPSGGEEPPCN